MANRKSNTAGVQHSKGAEQRILRRVVDHNVQGLANIRLINPPRQVIESMVSQLGVSSGSSNTQDIIVTFVERFEEEAHLRLLELNNKPFAFSKEYFYMVDDNGYRTRIDFRQVGDQMELVCEAGVSEIPLLASLLSLSLIRKGHVMLHASAFNYKGMGILATGWQTGGKSEMLLAYMNEGASYIADDWTIIRGSDHKMCGLNSDVNMWEWQFEQFPLLRKRLGASAKRRLRLNKLFRNVYGKLAGILENNNSMPLKLLAQMDRAAASRARASTAPEKLFRDHVCASPLRIDTLFLVGVVQDAPVEVLPVEPQLVAQRMSASQVYERRDLWEAYRKYRFAFPERASNTLELLEAQELLLLSQFLGNRTTYEVLHPYPISLAALYQLTEPFCRHHE